MRRTRILKVVPTLMCGGTENQFMTLGRMLDRKRFDLGFACLRRWGPFVEELGQLGIPLREYQIATFRSVHALAQQARLAQQIVRSRVDIVHAYNFYGNVFAIPPARLVAPVVIASIRDRSPYLTRMQKRVQRYTCQFADRILVNADAVKDWLIANEGYDGSKIVVIRNGVDMTRFGGAPAGARIRSELGIAADARLVVVVSRLARLKGIEHFLQAAAALKPRYPDVRFLVVGETSPPAPAYLEELKAQARALGVERVVIFTGLRSDVPDLLGAADVSVMPSLNEALSNVLLESMAAGAPVVATRVGGTPEALIDGETGLLVPPGDTGAIVASVSQLLDDPALARRLGIAARRVISEQFSVERMVTATQDLYAELLAQKQPRRSMAA
ncbi:MAG TPA: glycosyltransferase [Vicinamibacterales bacterium]|nr:glycosyltransferase [Vicinamibacterales bacterium]